MNRIEVNVITGEQSTIPLTAEEVAELQNYSAPLPRPDYVTFWDALLTSSVYSSIRTQSMTSLPINTLATEFIALIGDAKAGRPNEAAIQASISAIFGTGSRFTEEDINEFTEVLATGSLDSVYTLE